VNSKKELLAASLLAIALAAGLGTISYGFFAEAPPNARIDVFSYKNGVASDSFLPSDNVSLEARLSYKNASIAGTPVTFEVNTPNGTNFLSQKVPTNSLGIANVTFQIPWPSEPSLGTWQVQAASEIYGQALNATTNFECELLPPAIDVYTQEGGRGQNAPGGTFMLNETVSLYAEVRDSLNQTVPDIQVAFESQVINGTSATIYSTAVTATNASGIATWITRLPPVSEYAGTWVVYATAQYNDVALIDTVTFSVLA